MESFSDRTKMAFNHFKLDLARSHSKSQFSTIWSAVYTFIGFPTRVHVNVTSHMPSKTVLRAVVRRIILGRTLAARVQVQKNRLLGRPRIERKETSFNMHHATMYTCPRGKRDSTIVISHKNLSRLSLQVEEIACITRNRVLDTST